MEQTKEQAQPPTPRAVQATPEKQGMSVSLTNQLHQTAESVMKWKMQLESEIKLRDDKILKYQDTIKNMKSSLLSQQQNSESLSHKLQIEMLKRGDITSRIDTTRGICISLEKHCSYLSEALKKCCEEKDIVKAAQFEYVSELEKLIEKTENCDQIVSSLTKERDELMELYMEEKEELDKITEDSITLKSQIDQKMEEAKAAVAREAEKVEKMEASLTLTEEKCNKLSSFIEQLQQQIALNEKTHSEKVLNLDADLMNLKSLFEEKKIELIEQRAKLAELENNEVKLEAEIAKLAEEKSTAVEKNQISEENIRALALKLDDIAQELSVKTDDLIKLKAEKDSLEEKLQVIAELEVELAKQKSDVAQFSKENVCLIEALKGMEEDLKCSKCSFETSRKELEDLNAKLKNAFEGMQSLQKSNKELEQSLDESSLKLKAEIEANHELNQLLEQEKKEAADLRDTLERLSSSSATQSGELSGKLLDVSNSLAIVKTQLQQKMDIISNLSTENISLKKSFDELGTILKREQECSAKKITVLEGKLSDKVEELKIFNSGHSTLQESLRSLQEEFDGVNAQLNESNDDKKAVTAEKKELEKTLKTVKSEKNAAEAKLKRLETKVSNLEKEKKEMKEKMAKARSDSLQSGEQKDQAISDFEESIKEKEEQIAELQQSLNDAKAASEDELKGKESRILEILNEKNKIDEKLGLATKDKLELEGKLVKLTAQLSDTIKNSNEMSSKHESEKKKLKNKVKSSQDQLSAKCLEMSELKVQLNSQTSALSTMDAKLDSSSSTSASPLMNSAPKSAVSQKGMVEMKRSILKGTNVRKNLNTRKLVFSDVVSYISLEEDETSSVSSGRVPTTPMKTQSSVPTTPRRPNVAKTSTPQKAMKVINADDGSDTSSVLDIVPMNEADVEKRLEQIRSPARGSAKIESLATPTKRQSTPIVDGPQKKKKSRLGGLTGRQSAKYKNLEIN